MPYKFKTKILLTGGGTGGSVAPLLAVADELTSPLASLSLWRSGPAPLLGKEKGVKERDFEFLWIGTRKGPEKEMVAQDKITFKAIAAAKLRRYFSLRTPLAPLWLIAGFIQAFFIIIRFWPRWIITAGGFVSVPVVWAGWILRRNILVHQQDVRPGLANKLMAPLARVITVAFDKSLEDYGKKARWIGNPVRSMKYEVLGPQPQGGQARPICLGRRSTKFFKLKLDLPAILILGGGTGARFINNLVAESVKELTEVCQIIHVTGKGKQIRLPAAGIKNYYSHEFLNREQIAEAQQKADIVVSRCGMSTLSELSYLGKPSILIPIPNSHQVDNGFMFEQKNAAVVLDQPVLEKTFFISKIKELLSDKERQKELGENIKKVIKKGAAKELAKIIAAD